MSLPSSKTHSTSFPEYLRGIESVLDSVGTSGEAVRVELRAEARSALRGLLAGLVEFHDGSELHFREYIDLTDRQPRRMFAYHYQDSQKALIFRYDDAAHRPSVAGREHKHTPAEVLVCACPGLQAVLDEILAALPAPDAG